jgi:alpha/beta hydrolase family protein
VTLPARSLSGPFPTEGATYLEEQDYVQEEWFINGRADAADPYGVVRASAAPFATRFLVRRPIDGSRSSGSVFFDPLHMIREMPASWDSAAWLMNRGHVWVGVSVHNGSFGRKYGYVGGLDAVKETDPSRYAPLHLPTITASPPRRSFVGPAGADSSALRWDMGMTHPQGHGIVMQVAKLLRADAAFSDLGIQRIYGCGVSQTANFWRVFLDGGWHERARRDGGRALFDGYALIVSGAPAAAPMDAVLVNVLSEAEVVGTIVHPSTAPPDCEHPRIRGIELPGSPHLIGSHHVGQIGHGHVHTSERYDLVVTAVLAGMDRWISEGVPMPHASKIERDPRQVDGVARDHCGNALGGVRVPWIEVPRGQYLARCECGPTRGEFVPFDSEHMRNMYGDRETYQDRWCRSVGRLVDDGFLLPDDRAKMPVPFLETLSSREGR